MEIDLRACELRPPDRHELPAVYKLLSDVFPVDRLFFELLAQPGGSFYHWMPYSLFFAGQVIGNAALFPIRYWHNGQPASVMGLASVATRADCRRQGVARRLIEHCLARIDERQMPGALFTRVPWLYEKFGYRVVPQTYLAARTEQFRFPRHELSVHVAERLPPEQVEAIGSLYDCLPNYEGKVVRDAEYWAYYRLWTAGRPHWRFLFCTSADRLVGFARVEPEDDRLTVSELYAEPDRREVVETLLAATAEMAEQLRVQWITLALIPGHFVWPVLAAGQIDLVPEPHGANREAFMVRPAAGKPLGSLGRLQWPFADKF